MTSFFAIGCMSGSSLDGIDLCYVQFNGDKRNDNWEYSILKATTVPYNTDWQNKLRHARKLNGEMLIQLHVGFGQYLGEVISTFIEKENIVNLDFIASHGHTIFHKPELGYTFQLGDGETTAVLLRHPFVCNFRNKDVALGGQGAPLVPNGEKYLFPKNDICINLGGIANIGLKGFQGYDICPCNYISNKLAKMCDESLEFDPNGDIASKGTVKYDILTKLNDLSFYSKLPPKSLGAEWIESEFVPLLDVMNYSIPDLLRTYSEHVSDKLIDSCKHGRDYLTARNPTTIKRKVSVLVTGGGALNSYLMELFGSKLNAEEFTLEKADNDTINFKEALIFAFLGLRCLLNKENIMRSVTGSKSDSISGSIHQPLHGNLVSKMSTFFS